MKITFLGTGTSTGVPVITCDCKVCQSKDERNRRLRSSILIETPKITVCVDAGPDFREQMLRANVKNLDAIIFTHPHRDHTAGIDDIRPFNYFLEKTVQIYANEFTYERLCADYSYIFNEAEWYPGLPDTKVHIIDRDQPFQIADLTITPIQVMHYKMPVLGFRFNDFTYITDANYIAAEELEKVTGSRFLVINALRKEPHKTHFTLQEALDIIENLSVPKACLTHISHQLGLHEEVGKELPAGISLAYDGLVLEL